MNTYLTCQNPHLPCPNRATVRLFEGGPAWCLPCYNEVHTLPVNDPGEEPYPNPASWICACYDGCENEGTHCPDCTCTYEVCPHTRQLICAAHYDDLVEKQWRVTDRHEANTAEVYDPETVDREDDLLDLALGLVLFLSLREAYPADEQNL